MHLFRSKVFGACALLALSLCFVACSDAEKQKAIEELEAKKVELQKSVDEVTDAVQDLRKTAKEKTDKLKDLDLLK